MYMNQLLFNASVAELNDMKKHFTENATHVICAEPSLMENGSLVLACNGRLRTTLADTNRMELN